MAPTRTTVGRPRSFDEVEVLDRAVDVFWSRGAVGATTRVLETELGLTQSSIYNAFGTKQELLDRALGRYLERIEADVVAPLDRPDADLSTLDAFLDAMVAWISSPERPGCLLLNLLGETGPAEPSMTERARAYRARLRQAFSELLDKCAVEAPDRRADLLLAGVLGVNIAARSGAHRSELDALADALRAQIRDWAPGA